jgi:competence protein ComEC
LIDGGPDSSVLRELPEVMGPIDRSLDAVIATHPDADHIGGLVDVLKRYEVGVFIEPGAPKDSAIYRALKNEVEENKIPRRLGRRGMVLDLGGGALLEILYPYKDVSTLPSDKANEGGIVARLRLGEASALLLADIPKFVEYEVVQLEGEKLESDVLKVAHHGSKTSTSELLLQAAQPKLAIISVGEKNRYGHPASEVLNRLAAFGIPLLRTDEKGTVRCFSNGADFSCR